MDAPDPLLRLPDEQVTLPPGLSSEERLAALFGAAFDHVNLHAMAWPATDASGALVPPPDEHVLHDLAHANELADEEDLFANPRLGTVTVLWELPDCDVCGVSARYDATVHVDDRSAGAFLCDEHYLELGSGTLGASGDTYLMLSTEVSESVQATCNQIRQAQGKDPIF